MAPDPPRPAPVDGSTSRGWARPRADRRIACTGPGRAPPAGREAGRVQGSNTRRRPPARPQAGSSSPPGRALRRPDGRASNQRHRDTRHLRLARVARRRAGRHPRSRRRPRTIRARRAGRRLTRLEVGRDRAAGAAGGPSRGSPNVARLGRTGQGGDHEQGGDRERAEREPQRRPERRRSRRRSGHQVRRRSAAASRTARMLQRRRACALRSDYPLGRARPRRCDRRP